LSDGIHNIIGGNVVAFEREIAGRRWTFSPLILAEHAEKEAYICGKRVDVIRKIGELPANIPPGLMAQIIQIAVKEAGRSQFATREEEHAFDVSLHGIAWALWRALRANHEEFGAPDAAGTQHIRHRVGDAKFTITPAEGVQRALNLIESAGNESLPLIQSIIDGSEGRDLLKNSDGPETNQATPGDIDESRGQQSSGDLSATTE
jgi:hypothetical protein